jgi:hypothetical protein
MDNEGKFFQSVLTRVLTANPQEHYGADCAAPGIGGRKECGRTFTAPFTTAATLAFSPFLSYITKSNRTNGCALNYSR